MGCAKRLSRIDMAAIEEMVEKKQISVSWVGTSGQLADCLTKRGTSTEKLREVLYMDPAPELFLNSRGRVAP